MARPFANARHGGMQGGWDGGRVTAVPQMLTVGGAAAPVDDGAGLTPQQVQDETYNFIRHFQDPPLHIYRCVAPPAAAGLLLQPRSHRRAPPSATACWPMRPRACTTSRSTWST